MSFINLCAKFVIIHTSITDNLIKNGTGVNCSSGCAGVIIVAE